MRLRWVGISIWQDNKGQRLLPVQKNICRLRTKGIPFRLFQRPGYLGLVRHIDSLYIKTSTDLQPRFPFALFVSFPHHACNKLSVLDWTKFLLNPSSNSGDRTCEHAERQMHLRHHAPLLRTSQKRNDTRDRIF